MESSLLQERLRSGDTETFGEIVELYQSSIMRYLYRLTGDYETARDLAQDTFLQAYKNIHRTDASLNLNAWLYRIATNNANQYHRRKKIIGFIPLEQFRKSDTGGNGARPEDPVEGMAIKEALKTIPYDQRICVVLYYVEGFKCLEIAETLEISEAAVRKRISRGVKVFRRNYTGEDKK